MVEEEKLIAHKQSRVLGTRARWWLIRVVLKALKASWREWRVNTRGHPALAALQKWRDVAGKFYFFFLSFGSRSPLKWRDVAWGI